MLQSIMEHIDNTDDIDKNDDTANDNTGTIYAREATLGYRTSVATSRKRKGHVKEEPDDASDVSGVPPLGDVW